MKTLRSLQTITLITLMGLGAGCAAQGGGGGGGAGAYDGLGRPEDPAPFLENARTGTLPSGLTYYILENPRPEGRAYLTLAVKAGSVLEEEDERGLAHFVEHMAFNGTRRFPESELVSYLQTLGMRFGADLNAYTFFDETVYGIELPVEEREGTKTVPDKALDIMDDWAGGILFDPGEVDAERPVIIEEYRSRLGALDRLRKRLLAFLFQGSPYAERDPIGLPEIIETAPAERLRGFYSKWYKADNMALIIVGDIDGAALEARLPEAMALPEPETPTALPALDLPPPARGAFVTETFTDAELPFSQAWLYYKRERAPRGTDLAAWREEVMDALIDRALSLRFGDEAYKAASPMLGASAGGARYGESSRYYVMAVQAKASRLGEALARLLAMKEEMARGGFTKKEIDAAKAALLSQARQEAAEKDRQESSLYVGLLRDHFLKGETLPGPEWELSALEAMLPGIGPRDIKAQIQRYFDGGDLRVFLAAPEGEREALPGEEEIKVMIDAAAKAALPKAPSKSRGGAGAMSLLPETPAPGVIVSEERDGETGALRLRLGNGAEVIMKETANRSNEVRLYAVARGGTASVPDGEAPSARLAPEMLSASGLGPFKAMELARYLADKQASLGFWADFFLRGFDGSAAPEDLPVMFQMLRLALTAPRLDSEAVGALLDQYRTSLAQEAEDPEALFSREVGRAIYGNPRFRSLELADIDKVDEGAALAFLRRCGNPADYVFVFTGNIDEAVLRGLVETYLASIPPSGEAFDQWADADYLRPGAGAGAAERELRRGLEAKSEVYLGWFAPAAYSEEEAAAAQVLNEYLNIRLTEEIREKMGGVYSPAAWVSLNPIPRGELSCGMTFSCDPRRTGELAEAAAGELKAVSQGKVEKGAFDKAVLAMRKEHEKSVQSNAYIAQSYANSAVIYHSPLSRLTRRPALYSAVTPAALSALAGRLTAAGQARVTLYPEAW